MLSSLSSVALRSSTRSVGGSLLAKTALRSSSTLVPSSGRIFAARQQASNPKITAAYFSSGSHDDFSPQKKKNVEGEDEALTMIQEHVGNNRVMLYMKGNPKMPMCGFSARVVDVLQKEGVDFSSVNVLDYPAIREGVKKFSEWPTIPQLYVGGEFIGGCDIVTTMHESGELKDVLKEEE